MLTFIFRILRLLYGYHIWMISMVSCVAVQPPEGGPPDEVPPILVHTLPANGTLNFKGPTIRFTFNKDIVVKNPQHDLVIMPKLDAPNNQQQPYRHNSNGKTLTITLRKDTLAKDTTYTFHVTVQDTREGTKSTGEVLTFSTGDSIDSITVKGTTKELLTNQPVGNVSVYLYNATRDPKEWQAQGIPDYYTTADQEGNFTIGYIHSGKYYIRATTGKNNIYKIDFEKDKYGFFKDPIDLHDTRSDIVLPLVAADVRELKLLRSTPQKGFFEIVFNKAITNHQVIPLQTVGTKGRPEIYSLHTAQSPKIITIYNTFGLLEGGILKGQLKAEDALHRSLEENISIRFKTGKIDPTNLNYQLSPRSIPSIRPDFIESIVFNKPIQAFQAACVYFECENQKKIALQPGEWAWNRDRTQLTIRKHFTPEEIDQFAIQAEERDRKHKTTQQVVTLQLESGACIAFDQSTHQKISQIYPLRKKETTGTIAGSIQTTTPNFIIELLNQKYVCVDAIRDAKSYQFKMVPPGTYRMRILVLKEGEEEWSPGNILQNIEPSPVIFYEKEINVIENSDVTGIDFKF